MTPAERVLCRVHVWGRGLRFDPDAIEHPIVAESRSCLVAAGILVEITGKKGVEDWMCSTCRGRACGGACGELEFRGRRTALERERMAELDQAGAA